MRLRISRIASSPREDGALAMTFCEPHLEIKVDEQID